MRQVLIGIFIGLWFAAATIVPLPVLAQSARLNDSYTGPTVKVSLPNIDVRDYDTRILTKDRSAPGPLAFSFYRPGVPEPTEINQIWWYCDRTGTTLKCVQKVDWFGVDIEGPGFEVEIP